jgi:hypothetical protein
MAWDARWPGSAEAGAWLWLFPATYLAHIAEEGLAGERFYRWIARASGRSLSGRAFFWLNAAYWALMVAAVRQARRGRAPWLAPALGTIVFVNAAGHAAGSALTRSYSPGLVTGILLWAPLGAVALRRTRRARAARAWWAGVAAGAAAHGLVFVAALIVTRRAGRPPRPARPAGAVERPAPGTPGTPAPAAVDWCARRENS